MSKSRSARFTLGVLLTAAAGLLASLAWPAWASNDLVTFPEDYKSGVRYATVERGNIREEIYVSRDGIDAAKAGRRLPSGTVITMEDWREGKLYRYVVMEKRDGWGELRPPESRNGDWQFQAFNADRSVNRSENLERCFTCHKPQEGQDFVFTLDRMKTAR